MSQNGMIFDNRIEQPCDVDGIAQFLGTNANTVRRWVSTGQENIPYFKLGKRLMFFRSDVCDWLKSKTRRRLKRV